MDRRETEHLLEVIRHARAAGESVALATVVRVKGNAYRREGTRMVVRQNGTYECALSGGCLEPEVAGAAARVIATGEPVVVNYNLADDSIWGLGIGCTGAVDIRIERIGDDAIANEWLTVLERGDAAVLVTPLSGVSGRMIVRGPHASAGALSDPVIEQEAIARAQSRLGAARPQSGPEQGFSAEIFFEVASRPPELAIFGAGFDAVPLSQLAWRLGLAVKVIDVREAFLTPARFPGAALVRAHFSEFAKKVNLQMGSFVLVMNHHAERDQESLRFSLESDAAYIGVLGPRLRYEKLLADLARQGYVADSSKLSRVRSPVGLSLGAETPQEVAVSILAEILALRSGFEGGFLSGSLASLHRPEDSRLLARS
ncbi:MAG TPA: XdhC family protein [Patescibacteria group bacterium]|nr:XdhC family protein [Patescibacteria group bacterium]